MEKLPKHLMLELTSRCNYRCPFCYCVWHEFPALARPGLSTAAWKSVFARCVGAGADDLLFTGGEALLRKDLPELVAFARRLLPGGELSLFTNSSRLTEPLLRFFKRNRVHLATSLPGLATYGAMTGTRRTYRRVLEWIARAAELRWPMSVSLTATAANRSEFVQMYAAAMLSGAGSVQMGAMMAEGRGRQHPELMLTRPRWEALKREIRALPGAGSPVFCDELLCECRWQPPDLIRAFGNPEKVPCPAGKTFGVIGPSGRFRRCLHTVSERAF